MEDEILEVLRELSEEVRIPLDLPDEDQVIRAEEELLLPIPRDFRHYLLTASDVIYGHLELATVADPNMHTYLPEMAATAWSYGLPRYLLPLCEVSTGYYCIDPDGLVFLWENGELSKKYWDNLWEWIQDVWLEE